MHEGTIEKFNRLDKCECGEGIPWVARTGSTWKSKTWKGKGKRRQRFRLCHRCTGREIARRHFTPRHLRLVYAGR